MQQRLASRLDPPIAFAHRGARAHAPENTVEAFQLALRLGATGLESDVWVTSDGVAVLDHDGLSKRGLRKRMIANTLRSELPEHIPTLDELFAACGTDFHLSLDVKDPAAYAPTTQAIREADPALAGRTWLCDPVLDHLTERRETLRDFKLVHSRRLAKLTESPERHASRLIEAEIDAMNMHYTDWNGGLVAMFHRFGLLVFSWDLQFDHQLETGLRMGADAVYSDHVDTMVTVFAREVGTV